MDLRSVNANLRSFAQRRIQNVDAILLKSMSARYNLESVGTLFKIAEDETAINRNKG